jgi:hypothetical protein
VDRLGRRVHDLAGFLSERALKTDPNSCANRGLDIPTPGGNAMF